jgi:hypothetical protein
MIALEPPLLGVTLYCVPSRDIPGRSAHDVRLSNVIWSRYQ